jgi:hypothetical protein
VKYETYQSGRDTKRDTKRDADGTQTGQREEVKKVKTSLDASRGCDLDYSPAFLDWWNHRAKREGTDSKHDAWLAWSARVREGESEDALLAGGRRHDAQMRAEGNEHTRFVPQGRRIFGPSRLYAEMPDPADDPAAQLWRVLKPKLHLSPDHFRAAVVEDVRAGLIPDRAAFDAQVQRLDFTTLRTVSADTFAEKHIRERLNGHAGRAA